MTAAGVGSLLICLRQLAPYRFTERPPNPLLIPLVSEADRKRFRAEVSRRRRSSPASGRGSAGWRPTSPPRRPTSSAASPFYALYGIERVGALADQATLGRVDWFNEGKRFIGRNQKADGGVHGAVRRRPETAWAVLFCTKSTAKTIKKDPDPPPRVGHPGRRPRVAQGPEPGVGRRRQGDRPADGWRRRGDARRARRPPGRRRLGRPGRADRPLRGRRRQDPPAARGPVPEALLDRPRPGAPPRRRVGAGADGRPRRGAAPHQRAQRPRRRRRQGSQPRACNSCRG